MPPTKSIFAESIEPLLSHPLVDYIGEIGDAEKSDLLGGAMALLMPIDWPEPFGLVMIEAMSAGTPVIAWKRGSVPEIIDHGVTGFHVHSIEEAVAAVEAARDLDRLRVRRAFERRFTVGRMARNYIVAYRALISGSARPHLVARPPSIAVTPHASAPASGSRDAESPAV